jgi:hypothetical protein
MTVTCRVLHNGQPLVGAKVVFVPETFLDGGLQPGSGTTTATGVAVISSDYAADPTVKGLAPGFYRVQITKEGEKIHPKYNTETTLGAEAASRSEGQLKGLIFDLQY